MKTYNKIFGMFLLLATGITGACSEDFLDRAPRAELTSENFFQTGQQAVEAINGVYSHLRSFNVHVFSYIGVTDIASDDANKGSVPGDAAFLEDINNFTFDAGNSAVIEIWQGYYQGIFRANQVIVNVPGIDMDENLKQRVLAEARFLRAYFYFFLVRTYGDVPLIDRLLQPDEYFQERTPAAQVYDFIIADLQFAVANLPEKSEYPTNDLGRATKGAARGFLSKVYLFRNDFQNAYTQAMEVINSNEYALYPDY